MPYLHIHFPFFTILFRSLITIIIIIDGNPFKSFYSMNDKVEWIIYFSMRLLNDVEVDQDWESNPDPRGRKLALSCSTLRNYNYDLKYRVQYKHTNKTKCNTNKQIFKNCPAKWPKARLYGCGGRFIMALDGDLRVGVWTPAPLGNFWIQVA